MSIKFSRFTIFSIFTALALILAACSQAPAVQPTATSAPTEAAMATSAPTEAATATSAPTAAATEAATSLPGTGATSTAAPVSGGATVMVTNNPTLGNILTDANGKTLYIFKNDTPGVSNCSGACLAKWPALTVSSGVTPTGSSDVTGTLGTITRSDGTIQVTINQMPLYYFANDTSAGDTNGQGVGSVWYVVGPDGNPITTTAAGAGTPAAPGANATATSTGGTAAAVATPTPNASLTGKIALLLPEKTTARYEAADRPDFESEVKLLCPGCQVIYSNANQDANLQLSQAEAALTNGAKVMVLDPVDSAAAGAIADKAKAQGVPVIAYDRLVKNSDGVNYYLSFDNMRVGQLQAQALVDRLNQLGIQKPTIVMINGSPTDNNASQFKQGAHSVFDPLVAAGKLVIAKEYDTAQWLPTNAQNEMQQALTALGNKVDGVYAANDGTAGGAIAAMKAAGISPLPPVTGQDAQLTGIQNILTGDQYMTIYKPIIPEADDAAILAVELLAGNPVPPEMTNGVTVNNGKIDVPSVILTPIVVTRDNILSTVVKDGFLTAQQICTSNYASICSTLGIK